MNYAILRIQKRTVREAAAMARHALREDHTPNADPQRLGENTVLEGRSAIDVIERIKAKTDPLAKRKDSVRVIELFIGGSPETLKAKSKKDVDSYFTAALLWIGDRFGGASNVVCAVIHRDETTPHMQVLLTPIRNGKLDARELIGGPKGLRELQDDFAARVGEKHGLRRGERGSRAKHTSVKSFYAAMEHIGKLDKLPTRVQVPQLPELGLFPSKSEKDALKLAQAKREKALEHNRQVQLEIARLATVALATHGRSRRRLPKQLSEAEAVIARAETFAAIERRVVRMLNELPKNLQAEVVETVREDLRRSRNSTGERKPDQFNSTSKQGRGP